MSKRSKLALHKILLREFESGEPLKISARLLYVNAKFRKALLGIDGHLPLPVPGNPLEWKTVLDTTMNFTHCFSYYERDGETKYTLSVKLPYELIVELQKFNKGQKLEAVLEMRTYHDYPSQGKDGIYLALKEFTLDQPNTVEEEEN
jgi:hypothetical protein